MKIWIINYYTGIPGKANNPRYLKFARFFMDAGHEVIIFNAGRSAKISNSEFGECVFLERQYGDYRFVHVQVPDFKGNGAKRMFSIWQFARNILRGYKRFGNPDVILQNIHPPFDYPIVRMAKKLKCRYIAEVWDLWPESFVRFGLIKESNPLMKVAHSIEKKYYYTADEIVFTLKGGVDYLRQQGWTTEVGGKVDKNHVHYINNGIDLAQFDKDRLAFPRPDKDMNDDTLYKIVYLGSINLANHVKTLLDAAALLQGNPKYRFFFYGDGAYRDKLELYAKDNCINNVVFKERHIPFAECAWVVSQATVNVMNYEKGFGKWGASSGKMFQYLAAGKPIICNRYFAYDNVIEENNLGSYRDLETAEDFVSAIIDITEQPKDEYDAMCARVRDTARRFDYKILAAREMELLG